jgi:hypothetical protein
VLDLLLPHLFPINFVQFRSNLSIFCPFFVKNTSCSSGLFILLSKIPPCTAPYRASPSRSPLPCSIPISALHPTSTAAPRPPHGRAPLYLCSPTARRPGRQLPRTQRPHQATRAHPLQPSNAGPRPRSPLASAQARLACSALGRLGPLHATLLAAIALQAVPHLAPLAQGRSRSWPKPRPPTAPRRTTRPGPSRRQELLPARPLAHCRAAWPRVRPAKTRALPSHLAQRKIRSDRISDRDIRSTTGAQTGAIRAQSRGPSGSRSGSGPGRPVPGPV